MEKRLDMVSLSKVRATDMDALEKVKALEKKLKRKLVSRRIDDRTVICSTRDRIDYLADAHGKSKPNY